MDDTPIKVLLIEDDPDDALLIRNGLAEIRLKPFELEHVDRLSKGLERLDLGGLDVVCWTCHCRIAHDSRVS